MVVQNLYSGGSSSNTFIISRRVEVKEADINNSHISGSGPFQGVTFPCETWRLNWQQAPQDASWATLLPDVFVRHSGQCCDSISDMSHLLSAATSLAIHYVRLVGDPQEIVSWLLSVTVLLNILCYHMYDIYDALSHGGEGLETCEALTLLCFLLYLLGLDWNEVYCCANWLNGIYHNIKRSNRIIFSPVLQFKALSSAQIISV